MKFAEYQALEATNWSELKNMAVSPRYYRHRRDHPLPDTPAMLMGRAIHAAVLEPDSFHDEYRIAEPRQCAGETKSGTRCSKPAIPGGTLCHLHGGTAEAEALAESGVTILTADQGETVVHCVEAVATHKAARELLERAPRREVSIEWEIDGRRCKGRIDALGDGVLVDLKTTRSLARFARQAGEMLYYGQLAWYGDGAIAAGQLARDYEVFILAVENVEPWDVGVFRVTDDDIQEGQFLYRRLLRDLTACETMDYWPGMMPDVVDLEIPTWGRRIADETGEW
jgi:hypothetical protein